MKTLYMGVDMAKSDFEGVAWCKPGDREVKNYANTREGYEAFASAMDALQAATGAKQLHLIIEPTGGYQAGLLLFAYRKGWL